MSYNCESTRVELVKDAKSLKNVQFDYHLTGFHPDKLSAYILPENSNETQCLIFD
jgi:hypothetical protein